MDLRVFRAGREISKLCAVLFLMLHRVELRLPEVFQLGCKISARQDQLGKSTRDSNFIVHQLDESDIIQSTFSSGSEI